MHDQKRILNTRDNTIFPNSSLHFTKGGQKRLPPSPEALIRDVQLSSILFKERGDKNGGGGREGV